MVFNERRIHRYLIFAVILMLTLGLFVNVLELDVAKYATISLELFEKGHSLPILYRNTVYTDLPPMTFWLSTLSFRLFGISNFSYHFFGVIFSLLGIYATFQLTKIYYGQRAGRIAAIILGTTLGFFSLVLDFRSDTLLLGTLIFAIWQIIEYLRNKQLKNYTLGLMGISMAILGQGLIGLLIPVIVIGADLALRQKWKDLFKWQWLLGLVIIAFFLSPMIYDLDKQLRLSNANISGIRFFLTDQSFGHIDTPESNFSYIWAFLPWTILFVYALIDRTKQFRAQDSYKESKKYPEYISIAGIIITGLAIVLIRHPSIYTLSPFIAMLTGAFVDKNTLRNQRSIRRIQTFLIFGLWMLSFLLLFYIFTPVNIVIVIITILLFALTIWSLLKLPQKNALVVVTALWAISFTLIQSKHIYPKLSNYHSGVQVGKWLLEHPNESKQFCNFRILSDAEDFYGQKRSKIKNEISQLSSKDRYLYTDEIGLNKLEHAKMPHLIMQEYDDFKLPLTWTFLNPKTRQNALTKRYLLAIYPKGK